MSVSVGDSADGNICFGNWTRNAWSFIADAVTQSINSSRYMRGEERLPMLNISDRMNMVAFARMAKELELDLALVRAEIQKLVDRYAEPKDEWEEGRKSLLTPAAEEFFALSEEEFFALGNESFIVLNEDDR